MQNKIILFLSLPLAALVIAVSYVGLLTPDFYAAETANWQAQSVGQDWVDLFLLVPTLLISSFFAYRGKAAAMPIWGGVVLYLTYTFLLYCFDVHFNQLFVLYCFCLGLSFYSLVYFLSNCSKSTQVQKSPLSSERFVGIYFIVIALLFYFLWLAEILPALIHHTVPKSVVEAGLFTNGVQVIDLAIVLPAIFITGILLLRGIPLGRQLAPVFLTFFILMDLTIALLSIIMQSMGVGGSNALSAIMGLLSLLSLALLIWILKPRGK